ncbi:TPA_asm: protein 2 [Artemisia virus 1]|uniref:Protein 2 n=1 Tax=Artemisia virus 1 TaxID=2977954 RepID=A0A9N7AAZ0_9RHAB|nr:TPA_asm: protein 2 [Artemisia virus 1]
MAGRGRKLKTAKDDKSIGKTTVAGSSALTRARELGVEGLKNTETLTLYSDDVEPANAEETETLNSPKASDDDNNDNAVTDQEEDTIKVWSSGKKIKSDKKKKKSPYHKSKFSSKKIMSSSKNKNSGKKIVTEDTDPMMTYKEASKSTEEVKRNLDLELNSLTEEEKINHYLALLMKQMTPEMQEIATKRAGIKENLINLSNEKGYKVSGEEMNHMVDYVVKTDCPIENTFIYLDGMRTTLMENALKFGETMSKVAERAHVQGKKIDEQVESLKRSADSIQSIVTQMNIKTLDLRRSTSSNQPKEVSVIQSSQHKRPLTTAELKELAKVKAPVDAGPSKVVKKRPPVAPKRKQVLEVVESEEEEEEESEEMEIDQKKYPPGRIESLQVTDSSENEDDDEIEGVGEGEEEFENWSLETFLDILGSDMYEISVMMDCEEKDVDEMWILDVFKTIGYEDWEKATTDSDMINKIKTRVSDQFKLQQRQKAHYSKKRKNK